MYARSFSVMNHLSVPWRNLLFTVIFAACMCPSVTFGQTQVDSSWIGGNGNNWSVASDWNPNGTPNNGGGNIYNVTIDSGGADSTFLDINAAINSLVLGGTTGGSSMLMLQNQSGTAETLTITGALTGVTYLH
jgi:hypothetical protein